MDAISRRSAALATLLSGALCLPGCSPAGLAASLVRVPPYAPPGETTCGVVPSPTRPLVVEWPALDRAALEARARQGLVAVRYVGCAIEVLPGCVAPARYDYRYTPTTTKRDTLRIQSEDELYSNLPLGAARLEAKLQRGGELRVEMTIVGRYAAALGDLPRNELLGPECGRATHVVSGLTVGEFALTAAGNATVSGGAGAAGVLSVGGSSTASEEHLAQDGEQAACARARTQDARPPEGCAAPLRIEVTPIGAFRPECPEGFRLQGGSCFPELVRSCDAGARYVEGRGCVPERAIPVASDCPPGFTLRDGWCMPPVDTACGDGLRFQSGVGCVPVAGDRKAFAPPAALAAPSASSHYLPHPMASDVALAEDLFAAGEIKEGIVAAMRACRTGEGFGCGLAGENLRRGGADVPADAARGASLVRRGCALRDAWSCTRMEGLGQTADVALE